MFLDDSFKVSSAKALCTRMKMDRSNLSAWVSIIWGKVCYSKFGNVLMALYIREYMNNFKTAITS